MANWAADSVKRVKVSELVPYDRNSRIHPASQIAELVQSIREWGWTIPILIDEKYNVIAGHARLFAAKDMNLEDVPCVMAEGWTDEKRKAYVIADNKLSENSEWDSALYFSELKSLDVSGFDLSLLGLGNEFSLEDFSPNITPNFNSLEIGQTDLDAARARIESQIAGATAKGHEGGLEVICPHCAEEFTIKGY